MLHKTSLPPLLEQVEALNAQFKDSPASRVLEHCLGQHALGEIALVSSFGAQSAVLLHLAAVIDRGVPILFLETQMLFPETLDYQTRLAEKFGLTDVRVIQPDSQKIAETDPDNTLHQRDYDGCCFLRKTEPLTRALAPFDSWISGRKRFQGADRAALEFFEVDGGRIKLNPLAHWTRQNIDQYMHDNNLPAHPLIAQGYPSIGCAPCTTQVANGEDPRAGRWRGTDKLECGIHFVDGKMVRGPQTDAQL